MACQERLTYTAREVAEMLGVSTSTVIDQCRRGALPVVPHVGKRVLIPRRALHRLMPDVFGEVSAIDVYDGGTFT